VIDAVVTEADILVILDLTSGQWGRPARRSPSFTAHKHSVSTSISRRLNG